MPQPDLLFAVPDGDPTMGQPVWRLHRMTGAAFQVIALTSVAANMSFVGGVHTLSRPRSLVETKPNLSLAGGAHTLTYTPGFVSPNSITGCVAWYDFSDIASLFQDTGRTTVVTTNGQNIKGVTDKSTAGTNHLSEATNFPTYVSSGVNGLSNANFSAHATTLGVNDTASLSLTAGTIFGVAKHTEVTNNVDLFGKSDGSNVEYGIRLGTAGTIYNFQIFDGANNDTTATTGGDPHNGTQHIATADFNSSAEHIWLNSANLGSNVSTIHVFDGTGRFGLGSIIGGAIIGSYCEFIVYNTVLSSGNRASVAAYLKAKWGTP